MKDFEILDGNSATEKVAYALTEFASIYPITPSTPMAELYEQDSAKNVKNIFNKVPKVVQMQSESGVAGCLHGSLCAGVLSTTFTCSQGLLLMIPNMYKIAGEFLPCVIHASARTVASHALNIFGDHSDVMACLQTGFAFLCANNPQECADLAVIAHISTLKSRIPFLHFFDGFRTSHELQKVCVPKHSVLKKLLPLKEIEEFKASAISSANPYQKGTAQNSDIFFQNKQAGQVLRQKLPQIVKETMLEFGKTFKRQYNLFDYAGNKNAKNVIVLFGSACETMEEMLENNPDIGIVKVRLVNPFVANEFINILPKTVENICVLERYDTGNNNSEHTFKEVASALNQNNLSNIYLTGGKYGIGGKDFTPSMAQSVIDFVKLGKKADKRFFTIGINDDLLHTSLVYNAEFDNKHYNAMFFGLGSDGTVGASKNTLKIIGENTNKYVQGFFEYDSKKSGGMTISHIRVGNEEIKSTYKISKADFVGVHNFDYLTLLNITKHLKDGAMLLINTPFDASELNSKLTNELKDFLINHKIKVYAINAYETSRRIGLKNRINTIMQASFFSIFNLISRDKALKLLKEKTINEYSSKGENVVKMNIEALEFGFNFTQEIKIRLNESGENIQKNTKADNFALLLSREGDTLPASAFTLDGKVNTHTSKLDTRNISEIAPKIISENCLQCNMCSLACPHSVIRPKLISKDEDLPKNIKVLPSKVLDEYNFALYVDTKHCTGCGVCQKVCPARNKALVMEEKSKLSEQIESEKYLSKIKNPTNKLDRFNLRHTQYFNPYFEFCGACGGCGETPYIKLLTQLFGEKLVIANATGCSSIYSGSFPNCPFTKNEQGQGPAWANSLFEDNAEFGLGIKLGQEINGKDDIVFIIGGDGWAYDIGFGGLDHILTSGKNINILVLDTELYSNTGGQASKATPKDAKGSFLTNSKKTNKKPLSLLALAYQNVFVAQVSLGANSKQCLDAFKQAVEYDGVSLIIAYCPCINHGIDMSESHLEMMKAVTSGHFPLFTFNPNAEKKFNLQSKNLSSLNDFKSNEKRFEGVNEDNSTWKILNIFNNYYNNND